MGDEEFTTDPYGDNLTWLTANDFKDFIPPEDTSAWNRRVLTFIKSLPADFIIVLWWS